ncbi:MAG: BrnT family toxin [Deltaproteobacteria bacterium]|nr:BrnT family toxin [Deltaproteobacteria bacterium]
MGRQIVSTVDEERFCLIGPSHAGRMLSVVFALRDGRVRLISARLASRKEKKAYEEIRQAIETL